MVSNLDRALNKGLNQTDIIIIDVSKAFDKVPPRRLLHKLDYYGIRGSTHKLDCLMALWVLSASSIEWPNFRSSPNAVYLRARSKNGPFSCYYQ